MFELALPGLMSLTMTVPAVVPSVFHSSEPCTPSLAVKYSVAADAREILRADEAPLSVDVLDHDGAGGRAVGLPQLRAVDAVVGREETRPPDGRQVRTASELAGARVDVLDQRGAGGRAVALPQLRSRGRRRWP